MSNKNWKVVYSFDESTCRLSLPASDRFAAIECARRDAIKKGRINPIFLSVDQHSINEDYHNDSKYHVDVTYHGYPQDSYKLLSDLEAAIGKRKTVAGFHAGKFMCNWGFATRDEAKRIANNIRPDFPELQITVSSTFF